MRALTDVFHLINNTLNGKTTEHQKIKKTSISLLYSWNGIEWALF